MAKAQERKEDLEARRENLERVKREHGLSDAGKE
jgi:hypothetical protein